MVVVMILLSFFTRRSSMIIFMLASSISTVSASLVMYFKQKRKVEYYNRFVQQNFDLALNKLFLIIKKDLRKNYLITEFKLIKQKNMCIGYTLKPININARIIEKDLNAHFTQKVKELGNFHFKIYLKQITFVGKYATLFLHNLLLSIIKCDFYQRIIFIGNFSRYDFIVNAEYYSMNIFSFYKNFKGCIIVCNVNINLSNFMNDNKVIYLDVKDMTDDILEVNNLFRNKFITKTGVSYLYSYITLNSRILYIYEKKIIFNSSKKINFINFGIRLSENYILDIENKGPHGLIVGMTGSGKSVLLLQIIMEIALHYTPEEAVIGIIDFKGDSLISKVISLAHIASVFSNLSGNYENVLASIKSELIYRQKLFSKYGISEYNEINNHFKLPRLFILIDEFAEVKKNLGNIIEEIESIARVGRSLGIFLILSLQKSSGILTEQLKSNINYKICLKVNSVQDSIEVIGSKEAAYFSFSGEAIVSVNNYNTYIKVFNCLDFKKSNVVINGADEFSTTILNDNIFKLNLKYQKTDYVIWKSFPAEESNKILLNFSNKKNFIEYDILHDNYLIIGKIQSGKSELIKTIISKFDGCIIYFGKDDSFINKVDIYVDTDTQIEIFISYVKTLKVNTYFIIDGFELFTSELLLSFIEECGYRRYDNIRIIITALGISGKLSRLIKIFDNKFMLSVSDPGELFTLFYKKQSKADFLIGEGMCLYGNDVVEFKNYLSHLKQSKKKFAISKEDNYLYLRDFSKVCVSDVVLIYDDFVSGNFYKSFYYRDVNSKVLSEIKNRVIITNTEKFEYNFKRTRIIDKMMFDVVNDEAIIVTKKINCK